MLTFTGIANWTFFACANIRLLCFRCSEIVGISESPHRELGRTFPTGMPADRRGMDRPKSRTGFENRLFFLTRPSSVKCRARGAWVRKDLGSVRDPTAPISVGFDKHLLVGDRPE